MYVLLPKLNKIGIKSTGFLKQTPTNVDFKYSKKIHPQQLYGGIFFIEKDNPKCGYSDSKYI